MFQDLKLNPRKGLSWESLHVAGIWNDPKWGAVRDMVKGNLEPPNAQSTQRQDTEAGTVSSSRLNGWDGEVKTACWGSATALLNHKKYHAIFIEVDDSGVPSELPRLLKDIKELRLVIFGAEKNVKVALERLMKESQNFSILNTACIHVFLKEDPPCGPKDPGNQSVHRQAILLSSNPLPNRWNYVVSHSQLNAAVMGKLLLDLDPPQADNAFNNLLFIGCVSRPWQKVVELTAVQRDASTVVLRLLGVNFHFYNLLLSIPVSPESSPAS